MGVRYKKNGNTIVYSKNMTQQQVMDAIRKRMATRQKEIEKRQWIVDEHKSLLEKQAQDQEWLFYLETHPDFIGVDNSPPT